MNAADRPADDLRQTLLDASLELIATEGLSAFSMREVARRAGVSHQAPYHYFADREAILAAIVAAGFRALRTAMAAAISGAERPTDQLTAIGKAYIAFALAHPAHFKLMFRSEWVEPEKHGEAKACAGAAFDLLVDTVNSVAEEKFGRRDPALVLSAWSLAHGVTTLLLEGKLAHHCGPAASAQAAAADAVIERFSALVDRG